MYKTKLIKVMNHIYNELEDLKYEDESEIDFEIENIKNKVGWLMSKVNNEEVE